MMYSTQAWAKQGPTSPFQKIDIKRNKCGDEDVTFAIKYCGICHSDVHVAENDFDVPGGKKTSYPCVPGHELAGVVTEVGKLVTEFKVGDKVGVGCISDTCMNCISCREGEEQWCMKGMTSTYDRKIIHGHIATDSGWSFGGYSRSQTVNQKFIIRIPEAYPLAAAGPVFCAGITMFSPLAYWGAKSGGMRVGIIGIGGLGQMGVQLAKAMGNTVTAISTSPSKEQAAREIGADNFVVSTDAESMKAAAMSCDLILNTVSVNHEATHYLPLLANKGKLVLLGAALKPHSVSGIPLMYRKLVITGSVIGGIPETQECIEFCEKHKIVPKTKLITADQLDSVYAMLNTKNDSIIRNVLDIEASK